MRKKLLLTGLLLASAFLTKAQYNLTITYDATQGTSTLQGAAKVYIHSGGNDVAGPLDGTTWNYTVGNWGADDGIGEMTSLTNDVWTITIDPVAYYSLASNGPVLGASIQRIGMVFRDAAGVNSGKDVNNSDIFMDLSTGTPQIFNTDGTAFFGVTAGISAGINSLNSDKLGINNSPNPMSANTIFAYVVNGKQNAALSIYDATGRLVNTLFNELQSSGKHYYNWIGDNSNGNLLSGGVYYYSLTSGSEKVNGKLIIVR